MKTVEQIVCETMFEDYIDSLEEDSLKRKTVFINEDYVFFYKAGKDMDSFDLSIDKGWKRVGALKLENIPTSLNLTKLHHMTTYFFKSKDFRADSWYKKWYSINSFRREVLHEEIYKNIKELPNYKELYIKYDIDKKIKHYEKLEEKREGNYIKLKSTTLNISDQRNIVSSIGRFLKSKEEFKDHPLVYFVGVLDGTVTSKNVEKNGEKLGKFLRDQFNEKEQEEILQFLLTSGNDSSKRFAMIFDKSNAIINSLDNNELVRECANFFLKEKKE